MYVYMESDPPFLYWAWREAVREGGREGGEVLEFEE